MTLVEIKRHIYPKVRTHNIFIVIALIFGLFFVYNTPLLWGADETTQLGRAYQVSEGQFHPKFYGIFHGGGYGGQVPAVFVKLVGYVNSNLTGGIGSNGIAQVRNPKGYAAIGSQKIGPPTTSYVFSNTAPYSPLAYLPSAIGIKAALLMKWDVSKMIHLARVLDLLFYIAIIWWALKSLSNSSLKWIIFTVALLPMTLYQASIITADVLTNAICLLIVALFMKGLLTTLEFSKTDRVLLALSVLSLPLLKPTYLPLIFLVLLIPDAKIYRFSNKNSVIYIKIAFIALSLCLFGFWSYETRSITDTLRLVIPGPVWDTINPRLQEHYLIHHVFSYIVTILRTFILYDNAYFTQFFGLLGFNYVAIPAAAIVASALALILAVVIANPSQRLIISKLRISTIFLIVAVCLGFMLTTFYITLSSVGGDYIGGLQGRYFIPLAAPTMAGLALLKPRLRINKVDTVKLYGRATKILVALTVISLSLSALKFYYLTFG
jgi:uncharacterized membrane protein